jgi:nitroreductase/dihydropteridine reductase
MPDLATVVRTRYSTKAFDAARKIAPATVEQLRTLLRYAPSSVNSQPWHFVIAETDEGKARIAQSTQGGMAYNAPKVLNASHVVVLCARTDLTPEHLGAVLAQEEQDGRFATPQAREGTQTARAGYVGLHRDQLADLPQWTEKQVYLALGTPLLGAAQLEVDACPMEGFDRARLDEVLGLREQGLSAVVLVALGYRSTEDFNAKLPKSRLPEASVISVI